MFPAIPHTLIRLLALQAGILWPSAQLGLQLLKKTFTRSLSLWAAFATITGLVALVVVRATSKRGSGRLFPTLSWKPVALAYMVMSWYLLSLVKDSSKTRGK